MKLCGIAVPYTADPHQPLTAFDMPRNSGNSGVTLATVKKLRRKIAPMRAGAPLPSVHDLAREFSVSNNTIQRAYAMLSTEGAVETRPRKGVYVADRKQCGDFAIVARPQHLSEERETPYYRVAATQLIERLHEMDKR